jgi:hypothetical protein
MITVMKAFIDRIKYVIGQLIDLSLVEIRRVNDSLAKYGISVFSQHDLYDGQYRADRTIGDILSACRLIMDSPSLISYNHDTQATRNVWNKLQNHQVTSNPAGYGPSVVRSVASHLFNNQNQTSFTAQNPQSSLHPATQNVLASLFSGQSQANYTTPIGDTSFQTYPTNNIYKY